ncbi:hypothetical protein ACHWQZ_G007436 [Mnemiopsis leidyi]
MSVGKSPSSGGTSRSAAFNRWQSVVKKATEGLFNQSSPHGKNRKGSAKSSAGLNRSKSWRRTTADSSPRLILSAAVSRSTSDNRWDQLEARGIDKSLVDEVKIDSINTRPDLNQCEDVM